MRIGCEHMRFRKREIFFQISGQDLKSRDMWHFLESSVDPLATVGPCQGYIGKPGSGRERFAVFHRVKSKDLHLCFFKPILYLSFMFMVLIWGEQAFLYWLLNTLAAESSTSLRSEHSGRDANHKLW